MNEIIKTAVYIIFVVLFSVLVHYVVPYLKSIVKDNSYGELLDVVERAVRYAEQTITGEKKGKEKLNAVQLYLSDWLTKHGIEVSPKDLNILIESAVYIMNKEPYNSTL